MRRIAFAYVAVCRACGLPVGLAAGTRYRGKDPGTDTEFHRWAEVNLPNYGWVPVDASAPGRDATATSRAFHFGHLSDMDLILTLGGGDSSLFDWGCNFAGGVPAAEWRDVKPHP